MKSLILLLISLSLAGCDTSILAENKLRQLDGTIQEKDSQLKKVLRGGVIEKRTPFYGAASHKTTAQIRKINRGKPLPAKFEQDLGISLNLRKPSNFETIKKTLAVITKLSVISKTTYPVSASQAVSIPIGGTMKFDYRGKLSGLLDKISSKYDLEWSFDGNTIKFDRMISIIYDMPLPAEEGTLNSTIEGVNVGGSSISTSSVITYNAWKELEDALKTVAAAPASVTFSKNAGQVTILAPPSVHIRAAVIIERFKKIYSTRVGLEIATYFIDANKTENFALGVTIVGGAGRGTLQLGEAIADGTTGGIGIAGGRFGGSGIDFNSLARDTNVVDYRRTDSITQNGVLTPVVLLNSQNYVSGLERRIETDDAGETSELVETSTEELNTGFSIYALPRVLDSGEIQLSIWLNQANLNELRDFQTGGGFIQLPNVDLRALKYTLVMNPGETLVMGGYEQQTASKSRSGVGNAGFFGLGGSRDAGLRRTKMVVLVRPTLLK